MRYITLVALALAVSCGVHAGELLARNGDSDASPAFRFGDETSLDRRIDATWREFGVNGGAVAAARANEVLYTRAFGLADRERDVKATMDTKFGMASITKPITAVAIMLLVQDGLIELDAPVNTYLGNDTLRATFGDADAITVRRIMNHTAGLPGYYDAFIPGTRPRPTFSELIGMYGYTVMPPGVSSEYSNLGYEILAEVVRRVSGGTFEDFIHTRIFAPLGMTSAIIAGPAGRPTDAAVGYGRNGQPIDNIDFAHPGAAMAYMSVRDLVRFGQFWLAAYNGDSEILQQSSAYSMAGTMAGSNAPGDDIAPGAGLGFFLNDQAGTLRVSHGGSYPGVETRLAILPKQDLVLAIALNRQDSYAEIYLRADLMRSFAPEYNGFYDAVSVPDALSGKWEGWIGGNKRVSHLILDFSNHQNPTALIDGKAATVRNIDKGTPFRLRIDGEVKEAGIAGSPHDLRLNLLPDATGEGLIGSAIVQSLVEPSRLTGSFGYWVKLTRAD